MQSKFDELQNSVQVARSLGETDIGERFKKDLLFFNCVVGFMTEIDGLKMSRRDEVSMSESVWVWQEY